MSRASDFLEQCELYEGQSQHRACRFQQRAAVFGMEIVRAELHSPGDKVEDITGED